MSGKYPQGDFYKFEQDLTSEEAAVLQRVRAWTRESVLPVAHEYWVRAEFPTHLLPEIADLNILSLVRHQGYSPLLAGLVTAEIHRADASVGTFFSGHDGLFTGSIELLASEEQKERWLPDLYAVRKTGVFAITEPDAGSDVAQGMSTTARRVDGGWVLNGVKRWIGNATFSDYVVVWARDEADDQVKGFVVDTTAEGFRAELMMNRIALRAVQNAEVHLEDVFVPEEDKLAHANSFRDTNKVLKSTRSVVGWQAVGIQMGALDVALEYSGERQQFGRPLSSFQITQSKLATMLGNLVSSESMMVAQARLEARGADESEHSALAKAQVTRAMRETVALGRELMGGNGLVADLRMAKAFCDAEALYTYEGTYDINQLMAARALTGQSAFV